MARSLPRNCLDYLEYELLEAFGSSWLVLSVDDVDFLLARRLASPALVGEFQPGDHGGVDILEGGVVDQLLKL